MARSKAPSVLEIEKQLRKKIILPVYYLFGEDVYGLDSALEQIQKYVTPLIESDFDKETFYAENQSLANVCSVASTFPFGSQKKLIVYKQAEKTKDKKELISYARSPSDFTVLVCVHNGTISSVNSEPYKTLSEKGCLFEAKELKGKNLIEWLISFVDRKGKTLSYDNAQLLVDISGDDRINLESQLEKIFTFIGDQREITIDNIKDLSTSLKEYTVFDLQNALGKKDKPAAIKIAFNLLNNNVEPIQIIAMLNKYFNGISRIGELQANKIPDETAARIVGTHPYYYKDYLLARRNYSDEELLSVLRALLKADFTLKTTSIDNFTLLTLLLAEILPD